ncbi:MAG TPA: CAP domain-containing protein, partial [Chitinophagaceae bacterium]|nr:CAP domain-containing protein [Chitinophagaceae bacterium]
MVNLPFKVANPRVREDLEAKMLELVNEERAKQGLKPLVADPELTVVARAHSKDMFARGYFSHITPEGKTPSDRIREAHVRFLVAGENLALGQTLAICHQGLMNSPGHRANILQPSYGRLGIGILDGGIYGLMITQNFRN